MFYFFMLSVLFLLTIVVVLLNFRRIGKKYILDENMVPSYIDMILVLGAGIRKDGNPCDILADRLTTAVSLYNKRGCRKILLSGEHRNINYSEVNVMKKFIIQLGVNEEDILIDGCGFCTFDSITNLKDKFHKQGVIISTNKYHLPRAIFVARKMGIEAYGIASDLREYEKMKKYRKREIMAQIKDFILVCINR